MCRRIECDKCGRPSFAGCGAHVEQVLANVPKDQRCRCREEANAGAREDGGGLAAKFKALFLGK